MQVRCTLTLSAQWTTPLKLAVEHAKTSQVGNLVGSFKPVNSPKLDGKSKSLKPLTTSIHSYAVPFHFTFPPFTVLLTIQTYPDDWIGALAAVEGLTDQCFESAWR